MVPCILVGSEQDVITVGHAIKIDQKLVFHELFVLGTKLRRTEKTGFFVIKEHKGNFGALIIGQRGQKLTKGDHTGSVIIDGVTVGRTDDQQAGIQKIESQNDIIIGAGKDRFDGTL